MRIGFFGGTFDPPHLGHLAVAKAALREFRLDKVLLAPTGVQPLKPNRMGASFAARLAMVRLLCEGEPELGALDIDAPLTNGQPNYTVDTLSRLQASFASGEAVELFVIVGVDAFAGLRSWREPDRLLDVYEWIVVSRSGVPLNLDAIHLSPLQQAHIHVLGGVDVPVSATGIRALLHSHGDTRGMLPDSVRDYIQRHGLYR